MQDDNEAVERAGLACVGVVMLAALLLAAAIACCGCASYTVNRATGEGSSYGFLRSMTVTETRVYGPDGVLLSETVTISTHSTTGDVLLGANELLGTMVDGASKLKP